MRRNDHVRWMGSNLQANRIALGGSEGGHGKGKSPVMLAAIFWEHILSSGERSRNRYVLKGQAFI